MTKAQLGARIRAKKKINADLSPSPNRKRRKVADPAKEARSQGVALFSDDENDELAPLDMQTQRNVWETLKECCENFIDLPTHMDPNNKEATHKSKLAWIQLKKALENTLFLMKSRRIIISKMMMKELDLGRLLWECTANAPEKKLLKDLLMRLKEEMKRVVKRRETGVEPGAQVTDDDMKLCVSKFKDAFNRIEQSKEPVTESRIAEYAQKQAEACQAAKGNFAQNRDKALANWDELTKVHRTKLLKEHFHKEHWNFANLITQQKQVLVSTISNSVGNIILETTNGPVLGAHEKRVSAVAGRRSQAVTGAIDGSNIQRLAGPSTPQLAFDMANLAPPSSATKKQRSAVDLVKKAEKQRIRDMKEAKQEAKERARIEEKKAERARARKKKEEAEKAKNQSRYADKLKKKVPGDKGKEKKPARSRSPSL